MKRLLYACLLLLHTDHAYTQTSNQDATPQTEPKKSGQVSMKPDQTMMLMLKQTIEHTKLLAFVIQQIALAVNTNKITFSKQTDFIAAQQHLSILQNIIHEITSTEPHLGDLFILIHYDNALINHIHNGLQNNFIHNDIKDLIKKLTNTKDWITTAAGRIPNESKIQEFPKMLEENQKQLEQIIKMTDTIGLSLINKAYRVFKNNYGIELVKFTAITCGSLYACMLAKQYFFSPRKATHSAADKQKEALRLSHMINSSIYQACSMHIPPLVFGALSYIYKPYYNAVSTKLSALWQKIDHSLYGLKKPIVTGDCERVSFSELTGVKHLEELALQIIDYLQNAERYEQSNTKISKNIILYGPPQTGKTLFAKALKTVISDKYQQSIAFINAKELLDKTNLHLDQVFEIAKQHAPCILFFDEIDLIGGNREKNAWTTGNLLTNIQGINGVSDKIFIIAATNRLEQLDKALLVEGRFGKKIYLGYPQLTHRQEFLAKEFAKQGLMHFNENFIKYIAHETEGASYNQLKRIINDARAYGMLQLRAITENDIEKAIDTSFRNIIYNDDERSAEDKHIIALYQSAKALMHHIVKTQKQVSKITILPVEVPVKSTEFAVAIKTGASNDTQNEVLKEEESKRLNQVKQGEVFVQNITQAQHILSDDALKKEIMCLLAGHVALQLIEQKTYSKLNPHDRASAMHKIYSMIHHGEEITKELKAQALQLKQAYETECKTLLAPYKDLIVKVAQELETKNNLSQAEFEQLLKEHASLRA